MKYIRLYFLAIRNEVPNRKLEVINVSEGLTGFDDQIITKYNNVQQGTPKFDNDQTLYSRPTWFNTDSLKNASKQKR